MRKKSRSSRKPSFVPSPFLPLDQLFGGKNHAREIRDRRRFDSISADTPLSNIERSFPRAAEQVKHRIITFLSGRLNSPCKFLIARAASTAHSPYQSTDTADDYRARERGINAFSNDRSRFRRDRSRIARCITRSRPLRADVNACTGFNHRVLSRLSIADSSGRGRMRGAAREAVSTTSRSFTSARSSRVPPTRRSGLESAFGRVAEFVLHRGHRDITRVTLAGADRDARRCLCIAARALHLALSCERARRLARARLPLPPPRSLSFSLAPSYYAAILSFVRPLFLSSARGVIVTDASSRQPCISVRSSVETGYNNSR